VVNGHTVPGKTAAASSRSFILIRQMAVVDIIQMEDTESGSDSSDGWS